ncbi:DUF502 domain-containing protein [Flavobacterium agrisoli]|uniref:DUF502 domain-containing protein n=1 Tax=Flavobacterium agrisoli TaxID=2793066 RepID=A0A934UI15_9FLAO|nr:hypothetical protein [Flavobacterium agrisoli]MBK0368371.1 hypothetical protein [Flavobacterium agrisoli]
MIKFLEKVKDNCLAGAALLIPLYVFYEILKRVWGFFEKYGEKTAHLLGFDVIFGRIATDVFGGVILLLLLYFSGYMVRWAYLKQFSDWLDSKLILFFPGYEKNKKIAEANLLKKKGVKPPQYPPVLLKQGDYWQPAYLIEEEPTGKVVVFVPNAPAKDQGQIFVVETHFIKKLSETSTANLDTSVKSLGKGILNFK